MNLSQAFLATATAQPDKVAIFHGDQLITYGRLRDQALAVADLLRTRLGVQPGDRVGLWLKNCPEFVPALFGILHAGAVAVPINNFLKADEVDHIVEDAGLKLLISDGAVEETRAALAATRGGLPSWRVEEFASLDAPAPLSASSLVSGPAGRAVGDLAVLLYTSGTTGRPKGAMLTHGNLLANVESCRIILQVVNFDRFVLLLPMFHSFMLTVCVLLPMIVGGSIVLVRSLHPPKHLIAEIIQHGGTVLPAMAQIFRALAQLPSGIALDTLRLCISGAGPLPDEILRAFNARFPNTPLIEGYGLTEASPVVAVNPVEGPWKAGSIGRPIPGVEISIRDEAGAPVPDGTEGELWVRGDNVMRGYWSQPEASAAALQDGWLLTGDIGRRDPDGYFRITDRKKDMLKVNGINVYPREIEEALYRLPGVREAAVVGRPDPRRIEAPVAFVALEEGRTFEERAIIEQLRELLADYKVPREVRLLPALPRNATGKVLKTRLRELARETGG